MSTILFSIEIAIEIYDTKRTNVRLFYNHVMYYNTFEIQSDEGPG